MEIRKKTLLKVKKFLSATEDNESKLQSIAQKIEDEVFGSDSWVGQKYCTIAFKVLSALKVRHWICSKGKKPLNRFCKDYRTRGTTDLIQVAFNLFHSFTLS